MATAELLDTFFKARSDLFSHLETVADDLADHRDDSWNGDKKNPKWEWADGGDGYGEWQYSVAAATHAIEKDGLVFIFVHSGVDGHQGWLVFRKDKIEEHEEY